MPYEINVAKNGKHYFATAERSLRDRDEAITAAKDFKRRFPESEGFTVDLCVSEGTWRDVPIPPDVTHIVKAGT